MQSAFVELGPNDRVGDEVVLLGDGISEEDVAEAWGCGRQEALVRLCSGGRPISRGLNARADAHHVRLVRGQPVRPLCRARAHPLHAGRHSTRLDDLSLLAGESAYAQYHHTICHNLLFAVAALAGRSWPSSQPIASRRSEHNNATLPELQPEYQERSLCTDGYARAGAGGFDQRSTCQPAGGSVCRLAVVSHGCTGSFGQRIPVRKRSHCHWSGHRRGADSRLADAGKRSAVTGGHDEQSNDSGAQSLRRRIHTPAGPTGRHFCVADGFGERMCSTDPTTGPRRPS